MHREQVRIWEKAKATPFKENIRLHNYRHRRKLWSVLRKCHSSEGQS